MNSTKTQFGHRLVAKLLVVATLAIATLQTVKAASVVPGFSLGVSNAFTGPTTLHATNTYAIIPVGPSGGIPCVNYVEFQVGGIDNTNSAPLLRMLKPGTVTSSRRMVTSATAAAATTLPLTSTNGLSIGDILVLHYQKFNYPDEKLEVVTVTSTGITIKTGLVGAPSTTDYIQKCVPFSTFGAGANGMQLISTNGVMYGVTNTITRLGLPGDGPLFYGTADSPMIVELYGTVIGTKLTAVAGSYQKP